MGKQLKELRANLLANPDLSILKEQTWQLPIVSYNVSFSRVKRFKMDILMKMLLLAFQETDIHRAAPLADMLFVEELFIRDLIGKMQRTHLIQLEKKGYKLTAKGYDYLEKGIFEEEMDEGQAVVSYSAVHDEYRLVDGAENSDVEVPSLLYRYAAEGNVDWDRMYELLSKEEFGSDEDGFQTVVTDIANCEEQSTAYVPCTEFRLYDQKQALFYARVWNTATGSWDELLAKQIEEKEAWKWRKAMEEGERL